MSTPSDEPAPSSNEPFQLPKSVKELAAQATLVATMLLNEEMEPERGRTYSALVRSVAQLISAEVARARIKKQEPDLNLIQPDP
jgi:mannose/cellobiose epimerase-like protein (N-acyl-D-glucosamine 2-epimerase family)